mmetsp:Transcript_55256/g.147983  ORF Transcript_55256/g.147983 Transcript_55256/m.147983 type:complete len:211 (-) Transcript_55256:46-678(-)
MTTSPSTWRSSRVRSAGGPGLASRSPCRQPPMSAGALRLSWTSACSESRTSTSSCGRATSSMCRGVPCIVRARPVLGPSPLSRSRSPPSTSTMPGHLPLGCLQARPSSTTSGRPNGWAMQGLDATGLMPLVPWRTAASTSGASCRTSSGSGGAAGRRTPGSACTPLWTSSSTTLASWSRCKLHGTRSSGGALLPPSRALRRGRSCDVLAY